MDTSQKSVPVRPQRMFVYDVLKAIFLSTLIYSLFHSLHYNAYDIGGIKLQVS